MTRKHNEQPNQRLTSPCKALQHPGQLVQSYHPAIPKASRKQSDENELGDYSSPVCYAHMREFREGF